MKKLQRLLSLSLVLALLLGLLSGLPGLVPLAAAEEHGITLKTGEFGDGLTWTAFQDGTLCITGSGAMPDFSSPSSAPWDSYAGQISWIEIGEGITAIGKYAFESSRYASRVSLPDSLKAIGNYAFYHSSLSDIDLKYVETIGDYAFALTALNALELPATVVTIGQSAFADCTNLDHVTFSGTLPTIGKDAFSACKNLRDVRIPTVPDPLTLETGNDCLANARWHTIGNIGICLSFDGMSGTIVYGFPTTSHGDEFDVQVLPAIGYRLASLTADHGDVDGTTIKVHSEGDFDTLTVYAVFEEIRPGSTATSYGTTGTLNWLVYDDGVLCIFGQGAMPDFDAYNIAPWHYGRSEIRSVIVDAGVTSIGTYAFSDHQALKEVYLPSTVTAIGSYAFDGCTALTDVYAPDLEKEAVAISDNGNGSLLADGIWHDRVVTVQRASLAHGCVTAARSCYAYGEQIQLWVFPETGYRLTSLTTSLGSVEAASGYLLQLPAASSSGQSETLTFEAEFAPIRDSVLSDVRAGGTLQQSGTTWTLFTDGQLVITGAGPMSDTVVTPTSSSDLIYNAPAYRHHSSEIRSVLVDEGVTAIGSYGFYASDRLDSNAYPNLTLVELPTSLTAIGTSAFEGCPSLTDVYYPCEDNTGLQIGENNPRLNDPLVNWHYGVMDLPISTVVGANGTVTVPPKTRLGGHFTVAVQADPGYRVKSITADHGTVAGFTVTVDDTGDFDAVTVTVEFELIRVDKTTVASGSAGTVQWYFFDDGELYICGFGSIPDYSYGSLRPWNDYTDRITSVYIEAGVNGVGSYACSNMANLSQVTLPSTLSTIGSYAFCNCTGLTALELPDALSTIGDHAFSGCEALTALELPDTLSAIGDHAFSGCKALTALEFPAGLQTIGSYAFSSCWGLTSIYLPNMVHSVGDYAFAWCYYVTDLHLSENLQTIGSYAFSNLRITSLHIPNSVSAIGEYAFYSCSQITEVALGKSVNTIGSYAFGSLDRLSTVYYAGSSRDDITVSAAGNSQLLNAQWYYSCTVTLCVDEAGTEHGSISLTRRIAAPGDRVTVTVTPEPGYTLDTLSCPGADVLGYDLLIGSTPDTQLTVSATFRQVHPGTQPDRSGFLASGLFWYVYDDGTELYIGGSGSMTDPRYSSGYFDVPWTGYQSTLCTVILENGVTDIGRSAFSNLQALTRITVPDSVTVICSDAFFSCQSLTSITLGRGLRTIDQEVFWNCTSLKRVEFLGDAPTLGANVFRYTHSGLTLWYHTGASGWASPRWNGYYCYCADEIISDYGILDSAQRNPQDILFLLNEEAGTAMVGSNIDVSNSSGFRGRGGPNVIIPDYVTKGDRRYKVIGIGQSAFSGCDVLESITIGANVTHLETSAFLNCPSLREFLVDPASTSFCAEDGVLYDKTKLQLYLYPCDKDGTQFTVPDSVRTIGIYGFFNCAKLEQVTIGSSVSTIGGNVFYGCTGMKSYAVASQNASFCCDSDGVLFTADYKELIAYPGARSWPYYNIPETTTTLRPYAFYQHSRLENLYVPKSVENIGRYALPEGGCTLCIYIDSYVNYYAFSGSYTGLSVWYMDNYALQGLNILALPTETVFSKGAISFDGMYVTADGGCTLQLNNYALEYDANRTGVQTVTVSYQGQSAAFDILVYDPAQETVIDFGEVDIPDGVQAFTAVYNQDGQLIRIENSVVINGTVKLILPNSEYAELTEASVLRMDADAGTPYGEKISRTS